MGETPVPVLTFEEARGTIGNIFQDDFTTAVQEQTKERRGLFVLFYGASAFREAAMASPVEHDAVPGGIADQEPSAGLGQGRLVGLIRRY